MMASSFAKNVSNRRIHLIKLPADLGVCLCLLFTTYNLRYHVHAGRACVRRCGHL